MTWQTAITLLAPIIPVVVGYLLSRKKMEQIHLLVNSRLDEALHKIASLERALVVSKKKEA